MIIKNITIIIILFITFVLIQSPNRFCSSYCKAGSGSCSGDTSTDCTGSCSTGFVGSSGTCVVNPTGNLIVLADQVAGTASVTPTSSVTCGPYSYNGNYKKNNVVAYSQSNGIPEGHYAVRVIFWVLLIDDWSNEDTIVVSYNGSVIHTKKRSSRDATQKYCGQGSKNDDYLKIDFTFAHSQQNVPLAFTVTTKSCTGGSGCNSGYNDDWGIKQFQIYYYACHYACWVCWGSAVNQCTACNDDLSMKLSGTTCNQTCLTGYGQTDISNICVLCNNKCLVCYNISTNCTVCTPSGPNQAYLVASTFSCVQVCPNGYFGNTTTHICDPCNIECATCKWNSSYCLSCNSTGIVYGWYYYSCYNPCPTVTFVDNGGANCTTCNVKCITCQFNATYCYNCTLTGVNQAYWLDTNYSCLTNCPTGYYKQNYALAGPNVCLLCDSSCYLCTGSPSPCTSCNINYYLYNSVCGTTCPAEYFPDKVTWMCLKCSDSCTKLTMDAHFPTELSQKFYIDMNFTQDLDFTTFPYQTFQNITFDSAFFNLDMFTVSYQFTSTKSYRIILEPKGYIFLYNVTVKVTTMDLPSPVHSAANSRPFIQTNYGQSSSKIWFLIKAPNLSDAEKAIVLGLSSVSDKLSNITTMPYVQQIKKFGLFALLFGGAQITSCSILVNNIPAQNFYQGVRFWAMFIFFDVPNWQRNSQKTKYVVVPQVTNVIKDARLLFDTSTVDWRFQRTGHTSFFIFDTYAQIALILFCWLLVLLAYLLNRFCGHCIKKHNGKLYSFVHKVHQISILYISINTLLEWIYFNPISIERWISFGLCLLMNLYFLLYELFIYYDMIGYPAAVIGNQKYERYCIRYGSLLKNVRYQEYDMKQPWSPRHWFRPYNYHILSYYKKLLMMVSLPLFYATPHAQISVLIALQIMEMIRFCITWPYRAKWRNIFRIILESALLMFFITVLIQGLLIQEIMINNPNTIEWTVTLFYRFGWVGFVLCFLFNIGFLVIYIIDIVCGCLMSNREMMDQARRVYYFGKLKQYEQQNEDVPLGLVNKWVKLGNLNQRDYDELPDINLRVEYYRVGRNNKTYFIEMKKLLQLFMNIQFNFRKQNNVTIGKKMNKKFQLNRQLSPNFYALIEDLFRKYGGLGVQYITIKTFQKIYQNKYKPGDKIQLDPTIMTQTIQIEGFNYQKKIHRLQKVLNGFPIPVHDLQIIE